MKSILLIGAGKFGKHLAKELSLLGHQIMAVDCKEENINDILPFTTNAQIGDSTSEEFLASLGVRNFDLCIVTIGDDFQNSLETTSLLHDLGAKKVLARAVSDVQSKFLLRNGADEILYPEKQLAKWAAIRHTSDHILDYIDLNADYAIFEVQMPDDWVGKTIGQIDIRKKYNVTVIAVKEENHINEIVSPEKVLEANMTMLVLGEYKALQKCFHI
ncbi:MAG: TrkA family potassium uptake protein [Clostridia bacterium]|nr:TrkA family potassium uptake protein [Clostridia bacterium]